MPMKNRVLSLGVIAALTSAAVLASPADAPLPATGRFTSDGKLAFPTDYRRWIYLSSGLGMSYSPAASGMMMFDNVFVDRAAYEGFVATGRWPEGTMMVLENRDSRQNGSINKNGHFQTDRMGVEVHIKDSARFKSGWAFFGFEGETPATMIPTSASCYACHAAHAAVDTTFVQFYPTLCADRAVQRHVQRRLSGGRIGGVREVARGGDAEGLAKGGDEGARRSVAGVGRDGLDGSAGGDLFQRSEKDMLLAPAAGREACLGGEAAFERARSQPDGGGEPARGLRLRRARLDQFGGAAHGLARRSRQVEGGGVREAQFGEQQGEDRLFGQVARVQHADLGRAHDQLAQQGRDGHRPAPRGQALAGQRPQIKSTERTLVDEADAVGDAGGRPDGAARRRDPGAGVGPDRHQAGRDMNQLMPVVDVGLDLGAAAGIGGGRADDDMSLVRDRATFSRH